MRIFISWSGSLSRALASSLKSWVPNVFLDVSTWMSDHDIDAGARWASELAVQLEETDYGIICVTPDNTSAPWLLFEAGSLAKSVKEARVVPYLLGIRPTDITYPLAQFQSVTADREGTLKLVKSINLARDSPLSDDRVEAVFEKWWGDLDIVLRQEEPDPSTSSARSERELLEEILSHVRSLGQSSSSRKDHRSTIPRYVDILKTVQDRRGQGAEYDEIYEGILDEFAPDSAVTREWWLYQVKRRFERARMQLEGAKDER